MNNKNDGKLPPPPENPPMAPAAPETRTPVAVQIDMETYKEVMAILQELPYRVCGGVMAKLAPGVKAIFAEDIDDGKKEGAE